MRLYKYLLMPDMLINDPKIFEEVIFIKSYKHHLTNKNEQRMNDIEVEYNNKFYKYVDDKTIAFMSFEYPNYGRYEVAYTIIDADDIDKIRNSIIKNKMTWSANHDVENKQVNLEETRKQVELFKKVGVLKHIEDGKVPGKEWIIKSKFRTGGYINQGARKCKLHHFVLGQPFSDRKSYLHHRGHTFDNRKEYLCYLSEEGHDEIHRLEEPEKRIFRSNLIMIGDFFETNLFCDCDFYINNAKANNPECDNYCAGTLLIDNMNTLGKFIEIISSDEYKNLPR